MQNNNGRYGEDLSKPPAQKSGESRDAYMQRLKDWQRKRSMSGNAAGTKKPAKPADSKKAAPSGWADKLVRGLRGEY